MVGVEDWLAQQQGAVTREALLDYLRANEVRIGEVTKEQGVELESLRAQLIEAYRQAEEGDLDDAAIARVEAEIDRIEAAIGDRQDVLDDTDTRYNLHVLPGGENYRELLLTLPEKAREPLYVVVPRDDDSRGRPAQAQTADGAAREAQAIGGTVRKVFNQPDTANFRSSHWGELNVLAHVRFNERTDADGRRVLFIEEIQSGWHQAGRKRGYQGASPQNQADQVPDAPFKTTWHELALRRMVRWAAEHGFERIAWTTGAQQAERYGLGKQVREITVEHAGEGRYEVEAVTNDGRKVRIGEYGKDSLAEAVGKDLAEKVIGDVNASNPGPVRYRGLDLKVGGEGMKGFYDRILPAYAGKFGKRFGASVGTTVLPVGGDAKLQSLAIMDAREGKSTAGVAEVVHSMDITPAMREAAMAGLPLFARPGLAQLGDFRSQADRQKIVGRVKDLVRQMAPGADVTLVDGLVDGIATGKYFRGLITASLTHGDVETTVRHEVIHALREMGVIGAGEWATLTKAATDAGMLGRVQAMPGYATEPLAVQQEEAVAQLFGEWRRAPGKPLPLVRRVLARIRDFLGRLANALRGMGFHTPESIFERIERGDVGNRRTGNQITAPGASISEGRYAYDSTNINRAEVPVHERLFARLGVAPHIVRANYAHLAEKHPEHFSSPEDVRQHVEWVLANPTYALPSLSDKGHVVLVRRNGADKLVAVRFDLRRRNRAYWVRSAYVLGKGQLEVMFDAIRRQGGTPESLAVARLPEAPGQAIPLSPDGDSPTDRLIKIARGEFPGQSPSGSDPKYSLFNLRRAAAPMMAQPAQNAGTDAQRAIIRRHIGTTEVPFRQRIRDSIAEYRERRFAAFKQAMFDRFHAVQVLGREAGGRMAPWQALQLTKNLTSVMAVVLRHGPLQVYDDAKLGKWFRQAQGWQGGGFDQLFKPLADAGTLELWKGRAMAVRADRLLREGREHRLSRAEVDALLPLGKQHPEFQQVMDRWQAFNQRVLEMARDAGLLTQQQVDLFTQHGDYVPFYRLFEDDGGGLDVKGPRGGKRGVEGQRSPARRLKGGTSAINDPIENMVMNLTAFIDRSFKNLAMQKVTRLALDTGAMEPVKWKWWSATKVTPEQAARALEDIGVQVAGLTPAQHAEMLTFFQMQKPTDPNVVSVMVGGKPKYYRVTDPLLLQAVTAMSPAQLSGVLSMFRAAKEALTTGVTVTPAFMARNAVRDTASAWLMYRINPLDSVRGALKALRENDPHRLAIMAAGGGRGFYATDPTDVRRFIDRHMDTMGRGKTLNPMDPRDWWEAWHKVGAASEQMNRIARYQQVMAQGGSAAQATFEALDMLDFGMHGASPAIQALISMLPFFNARLQGLYKLGRRYQENKKGILLRGMIIAALTLALLAETWDDDRYEALEDWECAADAHGKEFAMN